MTRNYTNKYLLGGAIIAFFLTSCVLKKEVKTSVSDYTLVNVNQNELVQNVNRSNESIPETAYLKGVITLEKEQASSSLSITIKNKKDSIIWASVQGPFGIEVFRFKITQDSIFFLNRSSKEYSVKSIKKINELLVEEITFRQINEIVLGAPRLETEFSSLSTNSKNYILSNKKIECRIDKNNKRISKILFSNSQDSTSVLYSDFSQYAGYLFPSNLMVSSTLDGGFSLNIKFSKVVFNQPQNFSFKIPDLGVL